ncbi:hypothetical protein KUCAC02_000752, partial [Chaenocephalus aceratus]
GRLSEEEEEGVRMSGEEKMKQKKGGGDTARDTGRGGSGRGEERWGETEEAKSILSPHHEMAGVLCAATRSRSPSAEPNGMWRLVP